MMAYRLIDPDKIQDLLMNDPEYVAEFCEAGITTLNEFIQSYETFLPARDMVNLRKAGHKVKPGTQMMGAVGVIEEYERAKKLLEDRADSDRLSESVSRMKKLCRAVQKELSHLAEAQNSSS